MSASIAPLPHHIHSPAPLQPSPSSTPQPPDPSPFASTKRTACEGALDRRGRGDPRAHLSDPLLPSPLSSLQPGAKCRTQTGSPGPSQPPPPLPLQHNVPQAPAWLTPLQILNPSALLPSGMRFLIQSLVCLFIHSLNVYQAPSHAHIPSRRGQSSALPCQGRDRLETSTP